MGCLSIVIPSRNDIYLNQTVEDILNKAKGDIEVIVNLDGHADYPEDLVKDKRVHYILNKKVIGMRSAINEAVVKATEVMVAKEH